MTDQEYRWHWWETNKEMKRLLRRTIVVERSLKNLEAEMAHKGISKPKVKPKLASVCGVDPEDIPY